MFGIDEIKNIIQIAFILGVPALRMLSAKIKRWKEQQLCKKRGVQIKLRKPNATQLALIKRRKAKALDANHLRK